MCTWLSRPIRNLRASAIRGTLGRLSVLAVVGEGRECWSAGADVEVEVSDLNGAGSVRKFEAEPTEVVDRELGSGTTRRSRAPGSDGSYVDHRGLGGVEHSGPARRADGCGERALRRDRDPASVVCPPEQVGVTG